MTERERTDEIGKGDLEPEDRGDANLAGQQPFDGVDAGAGDFRLVERTTSRVDEHLARVGQGHSLRQAIEEIDSELGFESHQRV